MSTNRDSIRIKRGMSAELPESLPLGELAFCIDTRELWVGSGEGLALKRVTNTEITQHLEEWNLLYTEVDERFETKYHDVTTQFQEKFLDLSEQFSDKYADLNKQFSDKFEEICVQFSTKYNKLEEHYAQDLHDNKLSIQQNKESIDLLKRDIGTTENIEDLKEINNQATETLEQLNVIKEELQNDVLVIRDIQDDLDKASIDYSGEHHDNLKDSMDANVDFIMGEFNSTQMTGEFITAQNTLPRHIKRAELRGHTEVNLIQEPSGQDLVLPYEFEDTQSLTLQDTKESGAVNIVLKGNTEVNVLKNPMRDYVVPYEFEEGYTATLTDTKETGSIKSAILKGNTLVNLSENLTTVTRSVNGWYKEEKLMNNIEKLKRNTYYTILYRLENLSGNHQHYNGISLGIGMNGYHKDLPGIVIVSIIDKNGGWCKIKFQLTDEFIEQNPTYKQLYIRPIRRFEAPVEGESVNYTIRGFAILEGDYITKPIPFNEVFEGMQSVKMPVLTTTGKNLFNPNNVVIDSSNTYGYIDLSKHETLTFSITDKDTSIDMSSIFFGATYQGYNYDGTNQNGGGWLFANGEFALSSLTTTQCKYFSFHPCNKATFDKIIARYNIQIEEGSTVTSYEPHKTNILTVNDDVTLRGIGDVRDELNLLTGEYVQSIGEIVLDGRDDEKWIFNSSTDTTHNFYCSKNERFNTKPQQLVVCDKLPSVLYGVGIKTTGTTGGFSLTLSTETMIDNVTKLKDFLSQNPLTVQYELATESIKTVDLSILDQDGLSVPALSTYNEVTYINTTVPENSLKPLISSKTPEFPVMIKPNTKYSIVADTTTNGFDEIPLTYNLGGAEVETEIGNKVTVIQTPSTLENETFKVTGTGMKLSNVMILEKDLTGKEIPNYTEGMQSVKMPVLKTTGKNLFDGILENGMIDANGNLGFGGLAKISVNYIKVKPKTTYTLSCSNGYTSLYIHEYDSNYNNIVEKSSNTFTTESNTMYIKFNSHATFDLGNPKIQLEEYSQATTYEPYKSNILTTPQDVVLRGIGDVKDTLDLVSGELTERIGEIVLDGSEGRWELAQDRTNTMRFNCFNLDIPIGVNGSLLKTDKFPYQSPTANDQEGAVMGGGVVTPRVPSISILKTKLPSNDINGFKQWLSQNPITIQYVLAEPIIKTVDLNIINQNGQKVDKLSTFNGVTYVESSVAENSLKPIISHKDLEYEVLLKPNTKYSIITNPISNGHPNSPISFDLGGQQVETTVGSYCTLVTTPNSLTHNKLVMKGRGNKLRGGVMVIEGDKTGMMFNHFDGMKSVEEFTVKVANNNLFNKDYYDWSKYSGGTGQITGIHEYGGRKNCIFTYSALFPQFTHIKPNKQYTVKFDTLKLDDKGYGFFGVEFQYTDGTVEHKARVSNNVGVWKTSMATSNASKQIKSIKIQNAYNGNWGAFIDLDSFVIVEGTSIPQVESRHNSLPLIIPLRSLPNGVSDTLNLVTGEYVQRVAEHVLDDSESWSQVTLNNKDDYLAFGTPLLPKGTSTNYTSNNVLDSHGFSKLKLDYADNGSHLGEAIIIHINGNLYFRMLKSRLSTPDKNGWLLYLQSNPVTIQYELQEPIVTKLDLAWKDGKLFAYDGKTHIYVDVEGNKLQPMLDIHVPVNIVAELSRLRQEKEQLEISKTQLENQLSLIQYHNSDLVSNVENLVAENLMLKQQTQDLQNNSSVLQLKNRELSKHQEKLRNENIELQKRAKALTHTTENLHHKLHVVDSVREAGDLELLSSEFELDFRLMEIEYALDIPMTFSAKGVNSMARTPYEMAKTLILGGKYEREDMETKLKLYRDRGKLTVAEYEELIALMDANELA